MSKHGSNFNQTFGQLGACQVLKLRIVKPYCLGRALRGKPTTTGVLLLIILSYAWLCLSWFSSVYLNSMAAGHCLNVSLPLTAASRNEEARQRDAADNLGHCRNFQGNRLSHHSSLLASRNETWQWYVYLYIYMYMYMYVCIYIHVYVYIYVCIFIFTCICIYIDIICIYVYLYLLVYVYLYICICICIYICIYTFMYTYTCIYNTYVCSYIHIHMYIYM